MFAKGFSKNSSKTGSSVLVFQKPGPISSYFTKSDSHQKSKDPKDARGWEWFIPSEDNTCVEFCLETSFHGMKFFVQPQRHVIERLLWICAFLVSTVAVVGLICQVVIDYRDIPIITVLSPMPMPLDKIPFPAVRLCSVSSIKEVEFNRKIRDPYFRLLNESDTDNSEQLDLLLAKAFDAKHACDNVRPFSSNFIENSTNYFDNLFEATSKAIEGNRSAFDKSANPSATLRELAQPCREMILHCMWRGEVKDCSELFHRIETSFGYCCAFNTIPMSLLKRNSSDKYENADVLKGWKDANLDYDNLLFTEETKHREYPLRQLYPGSRGGLSFLLNPDLKDYRCNNLDSVGFMLGVTVPFNIPRLHHTGLAIKPDAEIFVGVKPDIVLSDDSVWNFPLETRKCYHAKEYALPHYSVYTASNCQKECITKLTLKSCNCTLHHMPQSHGKRLCLPHQYLCARKVARSVIRDGLEGLCEECLPTCTEVSYETQITNLKITDEIMEKITNIYHAWFNGSQNGSIVHVYFDRDSVYPKLRKETISLTQLIANCGGLLGVCLGCSVLSLLEIFYYGTLRLCCKAYHKNSMAELKDDFRVVTVKSRNGND